MLVRYDRRDIDRMFSSIPDPDSLWLTQPNYDAQPRERRPVDELPGGVTDYRPLCPWCGGHMIIVDTFERGGPPRGPPSSKTGVGTATP